MSAEVENNKEEEKKEEPKRPLWLKILDQWQIGFKLLELALAAVCMGFIYEPVKGTGMCNNHLHHLGVMYTTYMGCMVIIIGFLVGRALREKLGYRTSFVFSTVNATLFLATGILLVADRADLTKFFFFHPNTYLLNMMTFSIVVTFINALVFAADAVLTFKMQRDF